jgi:hypothetical protein
MSKTSFTSSNGFVSQPDNALSFGAACAISDIAIIILPWIERGGHGAPKR